MTVAAIFFKTYLRKIAILATAVVVVSVFSAQAFVENQTLSDDVIAKAAIIDQLHDKMPKAVIIDQLHDKIPNQNYQKKVTEYLETAGYEVDIYTTKDITVPFYKELPSMNYEFIVIRSHSLGFGTVEKSASLFTGELYSIDKYIQEQLLGQVKKGVPYLPSEVERIGFENLINETYFVVGSKVVEELMVGEFPDSIIVLAGCDTVTGGLLPAALLDRGASTVVGWRGLVPSDHNDIVILAFLEKVLVNGEEITEAVSSVMNDYKGVVDSVTLEHYTTGAT